MPTINSSAITWIDYEPISCTLSVTSRSGRTYTLRTTSPGWYFNVYLKGNYEP